MISRENIQAIYPPMQKQRTLAYYSLQADAVDPGFIQMRFLVKGPLHRETFGNAWQALLNRHESMRLSWQSPANKQSMLVAVKSCELPIEWVDLRNESEQSQQKSIDRLLERIREQGLDLAIAPVHRLLAVRTSDDVVVFFWACHHIFLDGWSAIVLLNDLAQLYKSERLAIPPAPASESTHAEYAQWLDSQSFESARCFWTNQLDGYNTPVAIAGHFGSGRSGSNCHSIDPHEYVVYADESLGGVVERVSTEAKVTTATIIYAAWAMFLAALTKSNDVVFGTTTAGRSFNLPDNQVMTGYFANVIPKRFRLDVTQSLVDFLRQSHDEAFSGLHYEYLSISEIQSCSSVAQNQQLFDNLLLIENLPQTDIDLHEPDGKTVIGEFSGGITSTYPLTLTIQPSGNWRFRFLYLDELKDENLHPALDKFPEFLHRLCSATDQSLGEAINWVSETVVVPEIKPAFVPQPALAGNAGVRLARNATELAVVAIWESILDVSEIDIHTEFIALGGRSIAAVRMLAKIEEKLGVKLSMHDLVCQPTVAAIASRIDGTAERSPWQSLIPLKAGGDKPPVIFVHAVGTHALFMRSVTQYFDDDQPVIGLQLVGLDGECEPMASITQIASHYLSEVKSYQSAGPYYFVGHCVGGIVAHEMIQQLHSQGEEVALFVVLHAHPPFTKRPGSVSHKLRLMLHETNEGSRITAIAKRIAGNLRYKMSNFLYKIQQRCLLLTGSVLARNQRYMELVHEAVHAGWYDYVGKPLDIKMVLISCENQPVPKHMDWQFLVAELDVLDLPIGHETMFTEPEVAILGANLSELVDQASATMQSGDNDGAIGKGSG